MYQSLTAAGREYGFETLRVSLDSAIATELEVLHFWFDGLRGRLELVMAVTPSEELVLL